MDARFYSKVLLLNADFAPLRAIRWHRAIDMILCGKAEVVEDSEIIIRSPSSVLMSAPLVARLTKYIKIPHKAAKFGKRNIYIRDGHTCQYCGKHLSPDQKTVDHIIPRAQGGKSTWENLTTSCLKCNRKKGNKTPEQAGMELLSTPHKPSEYYFPIPKEYEEVWGKYFV